MKRDEGRTGESWRNRRLPPDLQEQYDRRIAEIKAEERRKHPELTEFARRLKERRSRDPDQSPGER